MPGSSRIDLISTASPLIASVQTDIDLSVKRSIFWSCKKVTEQKMLSDKQLVSMKSALSLLIIVLVW